MGLLDNLERGIEKAVRGAFAGRGGSLGPVEIATAVRRHMDRESSTMSEGRIVAPNLYKIRLSEDDFAQAKSYGVTLAEELCDEIIRHSESQGYTLLGPVKATFVKNTELKRGQLSVESQSDRDADAGHSAAARPASSPAAGPSATASAPSRPAAAPSRSAAAPPQPASAPPRPAAAAGVGVLEVDGTRHTLAEGSTVIGRSASADITLPDTGISRKHVEVVRSGNRYIARDLGSTNGTSVDGEQLSGAHAEAQLQHGSVISLGGARLRLILEGGDR